MCQEKRFHLILKGGKKAGETQVALSQRNPLKLSNMSLFFLKSPYLVQFPANILSSNLEMGFCPQKLNSISQQL